MNLSSRENGYAINTHQVQPRTSSKHEELTRNSGFPKVLGSSTSEIVIALDKFGNTLSGEMNGLRSLSLDNYEYSNNDILHPADSKDENFQSVSLRTTSDETDEAVIGTLSSNVSVSSFMKMDPLIWIPPEPANIEDDTDGIAYNDEDDEDDYNDGTKWQNSTLLNDFDKQNGNSYKEARQKAMVAAMNGQFKILVNRFLASEGLTSSNEGDDVGWLDIVTFLSWESALFIKPDAKEGRAMDPGSYIKVKCVATGDRSESKVIKGLVFKKNTAHKHMPTKLKNPRLLLVKGNLGPREFGLSSFDSMDQEKDALKFVNEMIESCHPNLVLVEKSVSRDIQEFLLAKGMTLAIDMKLTRLERIARCTGSHVVSSADYMTGRYVKQCDTFRIEKFLEEHNNSSEVGRKSSKTLMSLEGFAKPLGCTILLKGAPTDELKRVKSVIQYTIFAAYHLILETSFFADQRALFCKMHASSEIDGSLTDETLPTITSVAAQSSNSYCLVHSSNGFLENSAYKDDPEFVPNNDFFEDKVTQGELPSDIANQNVVIQTSSVASTDLSSHLMSSFSASLRKLLSENYTSESISSFFGFTDECESPCLNDLLISPSARTTDNGREENDKIVEEMTKYDSGVSGRFEGLSTLNESTQLITAVRTSTNECDSKDDNDNILSPESILVLLSSQCIEKGLVCEQSHLSRIKYYGNFDISLGRYLQDVLLNLRHSCSSCGEPPEAHIYCYTHQNGNLTVLVKQLPSSLSGEAEGKIWMWSRCLKCEHEKGIPRSTTRVVMSSAARSLSFGKFLELSFTSHSAASRLCSECGHSLHRDCLRFFGLGSKVAMFRYSPVEIYAACKPLPVLEFANPSRQEWVALETKSVIQNVDNFFSEVASFLHNLKISCPGLVYKQSLNFPGIVKSIAEVEEMLNQEKVEFEASLLKFHNFTGELEKPVNEIPNFSWFYQELIFWLYIWDSRLHQLLRCSKDLDGSLDMNVRYIDRASKKNCDIASLETTHIQKSLSNCECNDQTHYKLRHDSLCNSVGISQSSEIKETGFSTKGVGFDQLTAEDAIATMKQDNDSVTCVLPAKGNEDCSTYEHMHEDCFMASELFVKAASSDMLSGSRISENGFPSPSLLKEQHSGTRLLEDSSTSVLGDPDSLIWVPFPELRKAFRMDLCGGYLQKFDFTRTYIPKYLSPRHHLFPQERGLLHYHFPSNGNIIFVSENEISSVIACALALSEEQHCFMDTIVEKDAIVDKPEGDKENDSASTFQSECSSSSLHWQSNGSLDSVGGIHHTWSLSSLSLDELSTSASESTVSWNRPLVSESLHPEVSLGIGKDGSKKYSVVCIHAKEFYALRRMCCPSERAYISSLSRCRNWDAQGGKSKAFFAKSMDERFIIKQIKKAELDSFLKFSGDYFEHITDSLSSGSQTCLAKILGIYQVKQNRNGKEVKMDLMVMENLLFGHNVTRTYDLKGAVFSRFIADTKSPEKVLLDQNFMEDMRLSPIYVGGRTKHLLQRAIWNDTSFLNGINVMDYSLLVGVDKQQRQLVFGIIDYLRQYTWDKQLETWVKASLVVPKNSLPTIISPKEYKKRFRKFMSRYFLTVPDSWCSTQCSDGCKLCSGGSICSSKAHGVDPQGCEV